jgi:long-subunit acyl-CoA synthetase (AMP-forming)
MKLANGEYVAPERIENVLSAAPIVAQIFVHGHSLESYLLAVVIPDPVNLARLASSILGKEISGTDTPALDEAVKDERVVKAILNTVREKRIEGVRVCQADSRLERAVLCRERYLDPDVQDQAEERRCEVPKGVGCFVRAWRATAC